MSVAPPVHFLMRQGEAGRRGARTKIISGSAYGNRADKLLKRFDYPEQEKAA